MERLNDIMGRAAPRRPYSPKQRNVPEQAAYEQEQPPETYTRPQPPYGQYSDQGTHGENGTNSGQGTGMGVRNPLREQHARLGQPLSSTNPRTTPPPASLRQGYIEGNPRERRVPTGEPRSPLSPPRLSQGYARQRPPSDERLYPPRPRLPEDSQQNRPTGQSPRSANGYHQIDSYQRSPADAVERWEDEEDENIGMEYGDWEGGEQEVTTYRRQEREGIPLPNTGGDYSFPAQDYAPAPEARSYSRPTRNLRGMYESMIGQQQQQQLPIQQPPVPLPPARTQEMQVRNPHYYGTQRRTQPLDPHTVAEFERDQELPADESLLRELRTAYATEVNHLPVAMPSPSNLRSVCPICKGAGYLRIDVPFGHPNFGKPIPCECKEAERKEKRRQQLVELSDLSAFYNKSFKNFKTHFPGTHYSVQEAFHAACNFAQNPRGWLVLIGPNGCGKTHLAAAIANQTLSDGAVVLFTVVPDLLAHLRATFGPGATEAYEQRFSKMRESEVLVLDDLGAHQSSPWASEKLFQLLNYRYNSGYPTVITANESGMSSLDERIRSRISDTSLVTKIIMNGALDFRPHNPRRM